MNGTGKSLIAASAVAVAFVLAPGAGPDGGLHLVTAAYAGGGHGGHGGGAGGPGGPGGPGGDHGAAADHGGHGQGHGFGGGVGGGHAFGRETGQSAFGHDEDGVGSFGAVSSELGGWSAAHASERARERAATNSMVGRTVEYRDRMQDELDQGLSLTEAHGNVVDDLGDAAGRLGDLSRAAVDRLGDLLGLEEE